MFHEAQFIIYFVKNTLGLLKERKEKKKITSEGKTTRSKTADEKKVN